MNEKTIAITIVLGSTVLLAVLATNIYPMAFAQSESETEKEQGIDQKNVCSGWAVCTNDAVNTIDSTEEADPTSAAEEDAQTLIATPH